MVSKAVRPLGLHTSIAGGLHLALTRAKALGCTCLQMFSHNPRGWRPTPLSQKDADLFRATRAELGLRPVVIHASYLVNVASPKSDVAAKSINMLAEELLRAEALGAEYVVVHAGSSLGVEGGLMRAIKCLRQSHEQAAEAAKGTMGAALLIEATSGKRGDVASRLGDLKDLYEGCGDAAGGVCLDTCHLFAAGYGLMDAEGVEAFVRELASTVGTGALKVLHLNDSKGAMGSGTDRHEHIGKGRIGEQGLGALLRHAEISSVPIVMETPRDTDADDLRNMEAALRLMS